MLEKTATKWYPIEFDAGNPKIRLFYKTEDTNFLTLRNITEVVDNGDGTRNISGTSLIDGAYQTVNVLCTDADYGPFDGSDWHVEQRVTATPTVNVTPIAIADLVNYLNPENDPIA